MGTTRYPGGVTVTDRPDSRGYWRVRGPGLDRRVRSHSEAEEVAWDHARTQRQSERPEDQAAEQQKGAHGPTVSDLIQLYLDGAGRGRPLAANTKRTMRSNLNRHVRPVIGDLPCATWDRSATLKVIAACERQGLAGSSVNKVIADLSAVAYIGRRLGLLSERQEPCKGLLRPQPSAMLRGSLPGPGDIERFTEALVNVTGQPWRRLQVLLLAYAGLRSAELLALDSMDIDNGIIHVRQQLVGSELTLPKHGKQRDTIYPAWLDEELHRWAQHQARGEPLFPSAKGGYEPYATWLRQRWQPAAHAVGWPRLPSGRFKWTAHTLRHYFGTWALSPSGLGLDIADVAMFMGHSSPEVTHRLYVQSRPDRFARARKASVLPSSLPRVLSAHPAASSQSSSP